jgi:hypothetical protein
MWKELKALLSPSNLRYGWEMHCMEWNYAGRRPSVLAFARDVLRSAACIVRGHDLEDTSTAGPDSGDMSMVCRRCGYSWHHQLY